MSEDDDLILDSVRERDIDLLIIEEIYADSGFSGWLIEQIFGSVGFVSLVSARRSVVDAALGETDIELVFDSSSGERMALLLENKIAASPQPDQSQRYLSRGTVGVAAGFWSEFHTCLVAPERYLNLPSHCEGYQSLISYESMRKWFLSQPQTGARFDYKASLIAEAIQQNRRGYTPNPVDCVTNFWNQYWQVSREYFPNLKLDNPGPRGRQSGWMQFPRVTLPAGCKIQHKATHGRVDLELQGQAERVREYKELYLDTLTDDISIQAASGSIAFRISVTPLNHFEPFEPQKLAVIEGLSAVSRMIEYANTSLELLP